MDDSYEYQQDDDEPPTPLQVMRAAYEAMNFKVEENNDILSLRLALENVDVIVKSWGRPGDVATIIVRLPVRANSEARPRAGEFLHRLNYDSKRKFWEMDYNDGEIRLSAYADTVSAPLSEAHFKALLHTMVKTVDIVFPYLTSVLAGRLKPDFAADQADAALIAYWSE